MATEEVDYPDAIPLDLMEFVVEVAKALPKYGAKGDHWVDNIPIYWMDPDCIMGHLRFSVDNKWEFHPEGGPGGDPL